MTTIKEGKMKIYRRVRVPLQASSNRIARIVENWLRCFVSFPSLYPSTLLWKSVNLSLSLLLSISAGVHTVSANLCDIFINPLQRTGGSQDGRLVEEDKGTRKRTEIEEIEAKRRRKKEKEIANSHAE